jgi:hypothetical protein
MSTSSKTDNLICCFRPLTTFDRLATIGRKSVLTTAIAKDETSSLTSENDGDVDYEVILDGKLPERDESSAIPEGHSHGYSNSSICRHVFGWNIYIPKKSTQSDKAKRIIETVIRLQELNTAF